MDGIKLRKLRKFKRGLLVQYHDSNWRLDYYPNIYSLDKNNCESIPIRNVDFIAVVGKHQDVLISFHSNNKDSFSRYDFVNKSWIDVPFPSNLDTSQLRMTSTICGDGRAYLSDDRGSYCIYDGLKWTWFTKNGPGPDQTPIIVGDKIVFSSPVIATLSILTGEHICETKVKDQYAFTSLGDGRALLLGPDQVGVYDPIANEVTDVDVGADRYALSCTPHIQAW